jgi:biotin carboxylase
MSGFWFQSTMSYERPTRIHRRTVTPLRILFSEGSSLTAREFLSVLGPAGHHIEVVDPNPLCICRFSRWTRRAHRTPAPGLDPIGYIEAVNALLSEGGFDVLLPTHEQAWLFAVGRSLLDPRAAVVIASEQAFSQVESKIEFARLLDDIGLPQPKWGLVKSAEELRDWKAPFYLKAPFSTAGAGVRRVSNARDAESTFMVLRAAGHEGPLMAQAAAEGKYAQVQALFDQGRLIAAHTSAQTAVGIGPSAAGRVSVHHPFARRDVATLGKRLNWHGGLTLDYLFRERDYAYIECNPRTVEPGNAAASGVDLPGLQLRLSIGEHPDPVPPGQEGVRTHGSLAILLGTAVYLRSRRAVLMEALRLAFHYGPYRHSRECLTPIFHDFLGLIPLAMVIGRALFSPSSMEAFAASAVKAYSVTPDAIKRLVKMASTAENRNHV